MKTLSILIPLFLYSICLSGAIITVTNADDSGVGSLRNAITQANTSEGSDEIHFSISGSGPDTIILLSQLPTIVESNLIIDATTQPEWYLGSIVIDAGELYKGLVIEADDCQIKGLHIQNALHEGIWMDSASNFLIEDCLLNQTQQGATNDSGNIKISNSSNGMIVNCVVGTDALGTIDLSGSAYHGIYLDNSDNITIQNTLISGFEGGSVKSYYRSAIYLTNSNSNTILDNKLGTDMEGTLAIPNDIGIRLASNSNSNQIINNVISGNYWSGIAMY